MGNVAIAFIESTVSFSGYVQIKRQKRIEHERIRSLIPRYLARLNNSDISITTLNLNGLGVDSTILRLLSYPFLSGETRVQVRVYVTPQKFKLISFWPAQPFIRGGCKLNIILICRGVKMRFFHYMLWPFSLCAYKILTLVFLFVCTSF